ncbi:MAG: Rossmann-like and DUF2520 domain-containing protein [Thermodesulfobacteriota bacterium]
MTTAVAIIGGGKLGTAMGKYLAAAGYRITGVCCRTMASALKAAAAIGTGKAVTDPWEITRPAQLVLLTTPDGEIAGAYASIVAHNGFSPGTTVLHCSGAHPSTILTSPGAAGVARGSFHPLQSFATVGATDSNPFQGIMAAIEGDPRALEAAAALGKALGVTCFTIATESKVLYHAAAVVASNYLVAIVDIAFSLLESAGIRRPDAMTILAPLIQGTLANIKTAGIPDALTGPIARGDTKTIADHVNGIYGHKNDLLAIYCQLGIHTLRIARDKGSLPSSRIEEMERLFTDAQNRLP